MGPTSFLGSLTASSSTFSLLAFTLCCYLVSLGVLVHDNLKPKSLGAMILAHSQKSFSYQVCFLMVYPPHSVNQDQEYIRLPIPKFKPFVFGGENHVYLVWNSEILHFGFQSCEISRKKTVSIDVKLSSFNFAEKDIKKPPPPIAIYYLHHFTKAEYFNTQNRKHVIAEQLQATLP